MSAALPYLHNLRKTDLSEFAEVSNLPDYESMKKADLEVALDDHLRANQTSYSSEKTLSDYYKRLGTRSPVKKEPAVTSGDEAPAKKQRRKTKIGEEIAEASEAASSKMSSIMKTPARQSLSRVAASVPLPPSPAAVSDLMERQTIRLRSSLSEAYTKSGITEGVNETRAFLSSAYAVQILFTVLEAYGLFAVILPFKPVITIPAVKYVHESEYVAKLPDMFNILKPGFWGPLSLWASTSFVIPFVVAYFFNIAHSASSHGPATRRHTSSPQQIVDPLVFNLAKALLIASVYYYHFDLLGATTNFTIEVVKQSVMGGELGMMTGAGIGAILSIYEAILKK